MNRGHQHWDVQILEIGRQRAGEREHRHFAHFVGQQNLRWAGPAEIQGLRRAVGSDVDNGCTIRRESVSIDMSGGLLEQWEVELKENV